MPSTNPAESDPDKKGKCEFTPCKTGPNTEFRKVISHIFGRNKALTKRFPSTVWVHYCRQHYQRARYRARDWPGTQCQLVLASLGRMEEWADSGLEGFRVVLRRRVTHSQPVSRIASGSGDRAVGRRVTRAFTSSAAAAAAAASTRSSPTRGRRKSVARSVKSNPAAAQNPAKHPTCKPSPKRGEKEKQRKKPTIMPSPVPGWLRAEADNTRVRSFTEIRDIVGRLKKGFERTRESGSGAGSTAAGGGGMDRMARFPDIEILPVFRD